MLFFNDFCCIFCNLELNCIFVRCEICNNIQISEKRKIYICLDCFSNGNENDYHKNDHSYKIINLKNIQTFDSWNVYEEFFLIKKLATNEAEYFKSSDSFCSNQTQADLINHKENLKHVEKWLDIFQEIDTNELNQLKIYDNKLKTNMIKEINFNNYETTFVIKNNLSLLNNLSSLRPLIHTKQYRLMNGYRAARSDFETEYNDKFEQKYIANLDYDNFNLPNKANEQSEKIDNELTDYYTTDDYQIENDLKLSILKFYKDLIRERLERKKMIHDFGLMNDLVQNEYAMTVLNKNNQSAQSNLFSKNLDRNLNPEDNVSHLHNKMSNDLQSNYFFPLKFQRIFKNFDCYKKFMELFNYQAYLKKKLDDLKEYRSNGIKSLKYVHFYKNLKYKRLNRVPSVNMGSLLTCISRFDDYSATDSYDKNITRNQCLEWFKKFVLSEKNLSDKKAPIVSGPNNSHTSTSKYPACHTKYKNNPLKIENYPDYEKLNEDEKEFCRITRVQPSVFLRVKAVLILENNKTGFCTYSRARKIAGIDVNKTRLIHNLLLKLEYIRANPPKDEEILKNHSSNI